VPSTERAVETGAPYSASYPISSPDACNAVGQRYYGPVVLITSARCYSTTDFFAAGFQDHRIGPVLGVDGNTGAGGANVWTHDLLRQLFEDPAHPGQPLADSPLKELPKGAGMRVAIRRSLRVGPELGTEVEDLGVHPDERHFMTKNDLLNGNIDLIDHAAKLLSKMPSYQLSAEIGKDRNELQVTTKSIQRLDVFVNGRPASSHDVKDGSTKIKLGSRRRSSSIELRGFAEVTLVAVRRLP
jgi:C-terminal processing protease CtpA/Prc